MLLTVRDSASAKAERRSQSASGRTTWILGDLGRPLEEVCRVATAARFQLDREKCTEGGKDTIQHYAGGTEPASPSMATSTKPRTTKRRRTAERSDVLVSAVISTYLLTHLHHVLQRAEYGAQQEGRQGLAANYAQLRKVLCLDARSMEDASASGTDDETHPKAA